MRAGLPPVVLQAGGKGERMRLGGPPGPKVLVPVQGVPLLERLLRQLVAEGVDKIFIIIGFAGDLVEAHVRSMFDLGAGVQITFIREKSARGNVGALAEMADLGSPILFAFGDLFTNLEFRALYEVHRQRGAAVTAASHFESHRLQLGHLIVDDERVIDYREKPEYQFLICSGIMAIEPEVLRLLPQSGMVGMSHLVLLAIEAGFTVTHWSHGAFWMDVNTPELLEKANQATFSENNLKG